jgi:multidrug resistance efflux pump
LYDGLMDGFNQTIAGNAVRVYLKALAIADQSKAVWDTAKANLSQSILTAPFDGTVASIDIKSGELVQVNQVVLTLATWIIYKSSRLI